MQNRVTSNSHIYSILINFSTKDIGVTGRASPQIEKFEKLFYIRKDFPMSFLHFKFLFTYQLIKIIQNGSYAFICM